MLSLLRKLRRQTAFGSKEMKGTQYIKYAIGEIVLVVIGILIALSINNLSEFKKDRKKEVYALESIRSNLNEDIVLLYKIINLNQTVLFRLDTASTILNDSKDWPVQMLTTNLAALTEIHPFTTNRTGIDQVIASSQTDIIRSRQLVEQLFLYYRDIDENAKGNEAGAAEYSRTTFGPTLLSFDNMSDPEKPLSAYRKAPFFVNAVAFKQERMRLMRADYLNIQKKAQRLAELINQELIRLE